jgi:hypothetical protein
MCTIITLDKKKYLEIGELTVQKHILSDSIFNNDGASLVFIDPDRPETDTIFRTMNVRLLIAVLSECMESAADNARAFIHLRASTTASLGVTYTHAFDNGSGVIYMHNGVIKNPKGYAVDSFRLQELTDNSAAGMLKFLQATKETFANIFLINTEEASYSVVRMQTGSLFTDGKGNFSTNIMVGFVGMPVSLYQAKDYLIGDGRFEKFDEYEPTFESDLSELFLSGSLAQEKLQWINEYEDESDDEFLPSYRKGERY